MIIELNIPTLFITNWRTRGRRPKGIENRRAKRKSKPIIPDYEGYGITSDVAHPYLSEELTARQVVDGVRYGIELYKNSAQVSEIRHPFRSGWRSVSVGYSQGGGTSMAVHRFIEQNGLVDELKFTGSVCGDGPYNPVATFMEYINQAENDEVIWAFRSRPAIDVEDDRHGGFHRPAQSHQTVSQGTDTTKMGV